MISIDPQSRPALAIFFVFAALLIALMFIAKPTQPETHADATQADTDAERTRNLVINQVVFSGIPVLP